MSVGMRGQLAKDAEQVGLGSVRRVHRERKSWNTRATGILALVILGGCPTLYVNGQWLLAVLLPLVIIGPLGWYVYATAMPGRGGRRWFVVCTGGVLIHSERLGLEAALAWSDIAGVMPVGSNDQGVVHRLFTVDGSGGPAETDFGLTTAVRDLLKALGTGAPAPVPKARRAVAGTALAAVLGLVVWLVVLPNTVIATVGELPDSTGEFARGCEQPGAEFTAAPARAAKGPRPVLLFEDGSQVSLTSGTGGSSDPLAPQDPADVQLLACSHETGTSADPIETCNYTGGITVTHYRGHYRIDVYEARTHRKLGSVPVDGIPEATCSETTYGTAGEDQDVTSTPDPAELRAALDSFVND